MADVFDYLAWRGDLHFSQSPFNDVDSLILCCLAYFPYDGIVSSGADMCTVRQAADRATELYADDEPRWAAAFMAEQDRRCFDLLARSPRFAGLRLSHFVNDVDVDAQKQFAAVTVTMEDGSHYIAFRGTDANLVSWKEDLNMIYLDAIPSQMEAVYYLDRVAKDLPGPLQLGGHSKGGNLAIFSACFCPAAIQVRITKITTLDSPGMAPAVLDDPRYQDIRPKIQAFVPQSSVVGMLLQQGHDYKVVHSLQKGLFQHDPYSWDVRRNGFVYVRQVTKRSVLFGSTIQQWLDGMTPDQRKVFVDALYDALLAAGITTVNNLAAGGGKVMRTVLQSSKNLDDETRRQVREAFLALITISRRNRQALLQ